MKIADYLEQKPTGRRLNMYGERVMDFSDGRMIVYSKNGARLFEYAGPDLAQLDYHPAVLIHRQLNALWRKAAA